MFFSRRALGGIWTQKGPAKRATTCRAHTEVKCSSTGGRSYHAKPIADRTCEQEAGRAAPTFCKTMCDGSMYMYCCCKSYENLRDQTGGATSACGGTCACWPVCSTKQNKNSCTMVVVAMFTAAVRCAELVAHRDPELPAVFPQSRGSRARAASWFAGQVIKRGKE